MYFLEKRIFWSDKRRRRDGGLCNGFIECGTIYIVSTNDLKDYYTLLAFRLERVIKICFVKTVFIE